MLTKKDYKEFVSLVRKMREAQDVANRAMAESDDYSEALIYIDKAEELEKEVDIWLKGLMKSSYDRINKTVSLSRPKR